MNRVLAGVLSFVGVVAFSAGACPAAVLAGGPGRAPEGGDGTALVRVLELEGELLEKPTPFGWLFSDSGEPTIRTVVTAMREASQDPELTALVIRLKDAELQNSQVEELGSAIKAMRAAGKKVCVFAEAYGPAELGLGSYADEVIVQSGGPVSLPGMHMEEMFLADTLAWVGIKADMVQVGDYKGASEQMMRSSPSPQWEQNISGLLDDLYANMRSRLTTGRNISESKLDEAMGKLWMGDAQDAKAAGLVDSVIDLPELESHLAQTLNAPVRWGSSLVEHRHEDAMGQGGPMALLSKLAETPSHDPTGPTIAVVHIDGPIVDGESEAAGLMGGSPSVGSRTLRNALEDIRDEELVKGVVVRINSPGGSATASEVIWQGLRRVAEKKPVWVSVGSMAASGGYYCAVGGDRIFVDPSSIVGSIGVVGGRMSLDGVYEKLHVKVVSRSRGPRADMFRTTGPWTPQELAMVRGKMTETYDLFTKRVTGGRKGIDLSKTAEGRLFTGSRAIELKMADVLGGLDDAIGQLATKLELEDYDVVDYPAGKGIGEMLSSMLGGYVKAQGPAGSGAVQDFQSAARAVLGDRAWRQISGPLDALIQLRDEPVLLAMPKVLVFR